MCDCKLDTDTDIDTHLKFDTDPDSDKCHPAGVLTVPSPSDLVQRSDARARG